MTSGRSSAWMSRRRLRPEDVERLLADAPRDDRPMPHPDDTVGYDPDRDDPHRTEDRP